MNINFIGKEFEKLAELDNFINYEFEPKTSIKYGKRNIYFDEIKLEFIDDVNIYGFSPYILQSFKEQRKNPNIKKYIKKKFNYGLTNYIKIRTKNIIPFTPKLQKKIKIKKKPENKNDIFKLIPDVFMIKDKHRTKKSEQNKVHFLKKALDEMGLNKLNVSIEAEKNSEKNEKLDKKNNIELIKSILLVNKNKEKDKNKTISFNKLNTFGKNDNNIIKITNLKNFFDKVILNKDNKTIKHKKILTLSKNRNILGNKKLFSSISSRNLLSMETNSSRNKKKRIFKSSFEIPKNLINQNKNKFLLLEKAIPYKYMPYSQTHK